ncbi:hypothetical protein [Spiroplasma sp. SV19]|uniref:hypothetical protein n=1 Tax=Spiroplasma sp. SV19 TaxID=2570468 RepID=UPI0024B7C944|nr:hypothetical protein [Spiroplasma sp. SV19]
MKQKQLLAENTQLKTNKKINLDLKKQIQKLEAKNQILKKYQTFIRSQQKKK